MRAHRPRQSGGAEANDTELGLPLWSIEQAREFVRPGLPLVREMRMVEHFEGVMVWGIGLERLECPRVLQLASPARLVVDLPTSP